MKIKGQKVWRKNLFVVQILWKKIGGWGKYASSPRIGLKTFNSDFSYDEVWFTDQNFKALETEEK